eukprot:850035-Pleurochrysis_carterae.AAC.3
MTADVTNAWRTYTLPVGLPPPPERRRCLEVDTTVIALCQNDVAKPIDEVSRSISSKPLSKARPG